MSPTKKEGRNYYGSGHRGFGPKILICKIRGWDLDYLRRGHHLGLSDKNYLGKNKDSRVLLRLLVGPNP